MAQEGKMFRKFKQYIKNVFSTLKLSHKVKLCHQTSSEKNYVSVSEEGVGMQEEASVKNSI